MLDKVALGVKQFLHGHSRGVLEVGADIVFEVNDARRLV